MHPVFLRVSETIEVTNFIYCVFQSKLSCMTAPKTNEKKNKKKKCLVFNEHCVIVFFYASKARFSIRKTVHVDVFLESIGYVNN